MHTNSPTSLQQFRGNKKWSYYDNSGQVVGQPTVQCIMLNTAAAPFNNHSAAHGHGQGQSTSAQFAKVIDKGVDAPMNGLFLPGSPYYTKTAYPAPRPGGRGQAGQADPAADGQAGVLHPQLDQQPRRRCGRPSSSSRPGRQAGMKVNINIHGPVDAHQRRAGRHLPGHLWRQFGAVDPDLNYVWWSTQTGLGPHAAQHGPQRRPPHSGRPARPAGRRAIQAARIKAYQKVNQYLAEDIPYICGWPATPGPSWPTPRCRTSPTRRRRRARRPSPSTRACSGRPRSGSRSARAQRISTSSRYSSRQWVKRSSGRRRQ